MKFIGIDNGVSGSIGVVDEQGRCHAIIPTPTVKQLNYTKTKAWINRVDVVKLRAYLSLYQDAKCAIERPMVNPGRFKATVSAIRALEATQIVLESLQIPYEFLDSKEWQRELLPKGLQKEELKAASVEIARRKFPETMIHFKGDGDGILIAEYLRMKNNGNF